MYFFKLLIETVVGWKTQLQQNLCTAVRLPPSNHHHHQPELGDDNGDEYHLFWDPDYKQVSNLTQNLQSHTEKRNKYLLCLNHRVWYVIKTNFTVFQRS